MWNRVALMRMRPESCGYQGTKRRDRGYLSRSSFRGLAFPVFLFFILKEWVACLKWISEGENEKLYLKLVFLRAYVLLVLSLCIWLTLRALVQIILGVATVYWLDRICRRLLGWHMTSRQKKFNILHWPRHQGHLPVWTNLALAKNF